MRTRILSHVLLGSSLLVGGLCLSPQAAHLQEKDLFPMPSAGIRVPGRGVEESSLEAMLRDFAAVTGENLTWTEQTGERLKAEHPGLDRALEIPAEALYSVVETILVQNHLAFLDISREEPRVLAVIQLDRDGSEPPGSRAKFVPPDQLPLYADHPGIRIATTVTLEHLDGKTLGRTLPAVIRDPLCLSVVPDLKTKQLTLTGHGPALANQVRILQDLNEAARLLAESR